MHFQWDILYRWSCESFVTKPTYSLYNFEIRRDVTSYSGRLHISGELPCNAHIVYGIAAKHVCVMVTRSEVRHLPEVTSIISKLYRL